MAAGSGDLTVEESKKSASDTIAWWVTEIFTPASSVVAISLLCGIKGAAGWPGVAYGAAVGAFCGAIPYITLEIAARRERITDRHVTQHDQRPWAYGVCLASVAAGFVTMAFLDAPALLIWALVTMAFGLVVTGGVTFVGPKVSMHAFCLVVLGILAALLLSPWWLLALVAALPVVVWSRLRLGHHSPVEVAWGTALGVLVILIAWQFAPA